MWYRADKTFQELSNPEKHQLVTEIDVTYGDDKPWYGFERLERPVTSSTETTVWLTIRRGVKRK